MIRIAQLRPYDIANGIGIRTTLFVSGCNIKCPECFNKEYQNFNYGEPITEEYIDKIIEMIKKPEISGFSILGGEPLAQNIDELSHLLKRIKTETSKTIWMWTGYLYDFLSQEQKRIVNNYVDIIIDGQFVNELKDLTLQFRGSSNQRIIDVKKSLKENKIIEWKV